MPQRRRRRADAVQELEAALRPTTALVSVMCVGCAVCSALDMHRYVNNEIGVVQPVDAIGALCRKHKTFFHTDAAQACRTVMPPNAEASSGRRQSAHQRQRQQH